MKQLLILSGKGGTGKTTVASALIDLSQCHAFADCDVDAPNLHLVIPPMTEVRKTRFLGLEKGVIDADKCTQCNLCEEHCRFDAIRDYQIDLMACEGCGVCEEICPTGAITLEDTPSGDLLLYQDPAKVFSTAELKMGSGASGKLVSAVKQQLLQKAALVKLAVIDGSPGIGCPVIASISGAQMVLIVAEPTVSGVHDMKRIIKTAKHFGAACAVCINKYDINQENTTAIEAYCKNIHIPVLGKIPFDQRVQKAVNQCQSITRYPQSPATKAIAEIWDKIHQMLFGSDAKS